MKPKLFSCMRTVIGSVTFAPHSKSSACLVLALLCVCTGESAYPIRSFGNNTGASQTASSWHTFFDQGKEALQRQSLAKAEALFRQALRLVQIQSHNPIDLEKCMLSLADALALNYKTAEAQRLYMRLLESDSKRYGSKSPHLAPVLLALGSLQESQGNHDAAIGYYNRALSINEKSYGSYSPAFANNLHQLANAKYKAGHTHEAKQNYKQALSILAQEPGLEASKQLQGLIVDYNDVLKGNDNSDRDLIKDFRSEIVNGKAQKLSSETQPTSAPEVNLRGPVQPLVDQPVEQAQHPSSLSTTDERTVGSAWQQQNQLELNSSRQGETDLNSSVFSRTSVQTNSDASLAPAFKIVSDAVFKQNHYENGEPYYQRMIATDVTSLGPNHPAVANDLNGLAQLYISQKRYADAEPLLKRALLIYEQAYGMDNLLTINTTLTLASTEFHLDNADQAATLYRSALSRGQSIFGPNKLETARILNELAYTYFHQGKLLESCAFYEWAISSTEGAVGQTDPLLAASLTDYAHVLRSLGRTTDAETVEMRASQILANAK